MLNTFFSFAFDSIKFHSNENKNTFLKIILITLTDINIHRFCFDEVSFYHSNYRKGLTKQKQKIVSVMAIMMMMII